uniref:Uncharacterized protein n=1 Tax=Schimmelmannia schousboei TaxID=173468 RepID=A0A1C9C8T2_9FLOR|nr:hypothetical protein Schim_107 [Schimmelmannia schousboei]AOM64788.1 hypothetical protein Schim_107 [Schimmelmannia schousboei]
MFQLYLICAICFLLPICFLISSELYKLIARNIIYWNINNKSIKKENILGLANIYIKTKKWLTCILMLEFHLDNEINFEYYNCLGFCYQQISLNEKAKFYYLQASYQEPHNIICLQNVAKIYDILNDQQNAIKSYKKILSIDTSNQIAQKYLHQFINHK